MVQKIKVIGMTCEACEYKVKHLFGSLAGVTKVEIDRLANKVEVVTETRHSIEDYQNLLKPYPKYSAEVYPKDNVVSEIIIEQPKSWIETYKPLLIIAGFITGIAFLTAFHANIYAFEHFSLKMFLHNFMTGFFLVFAFFKLLDTKSFAESFAMYDLLAMKIPIYGKIYPFIEISLGVLCLIHFEPKIVYIADILIMGFGAIGVIQSVVDKRNIRCACLGSVFNLPMSTVTIIENTIMVIVGVILLII